ncbi:MAG: DNA mismatch repair endonuclease MutL [Spirochaetaceae bacterium]|nr:MAG: DNA mismatch repair endonuclease MutL [Spirochaetaceae bacterium]
MSQNRPVRVLRDEVARKIAAGEVIDRPQAVVRELLDNALDAGADRIDLHIADGGRARIEVIDNGSGMSRDDLEICHLPHATSKIETEADLERVSSLGFRGEALSSVASVARLTIRSGQHHDRPGHELVVHGGSVVALSACEAIRGTRVTVEDLFYCVPARRSFLKRAASEGGLCRTVLLDKAAAFPEVTFRFFVDGDLRLFLPAADAEARLLACYAEIGDRKLLSTITGSGDGFSLSAVTTGAALLRRDRRLTQVFVNRRRVWEYALVQAIEHAFDPVAPGGSHPVCFLFIQCDPALVDFNIHPAKREVRFRNLPDIHRRTVETVSAFLHASVIAERISPSPSPLFPPDPRPAYADRPVEMLGEQSPPVYRPLHELRPAHASTRTGAVLGNVAGPVANASPSDAGSANGGSFRYLACAFNLYLLVERDGRLLIVDQHAGHERILYDRFRAQGGVQELLVPILVEVDAQEDRVLRDRSEEIAALGIRAERSGPGRWSITALGAAYLRHQDEVVETVREVTRHPKELVQRFYAQMACKAAVKQGDRLDDTGAITLLRQIFALPEPRCPHGRPLWAEISREQLAAMVGRT